MDNKSLESLREDQRETQGALASLQKVVVGLETKSDASTGLSSKMTRLKAEHEAHSKRGQALHEASEARSQKRMAALESQLAEVVSMSTGLKKQHLTLSEQMSGVDQKVDAVDHKGHANLQNARKEREAEVSNLMRTMALMPTIQMLTLNLTYRGRPLN